MAGLPDMTAKLTGRAKELFDEMSARRKAQGTGLHGLCIPLMNHPELAQHIERLGYYLKFEGKLPRDAYQFVVLSMARKLRVAFEWVDHLAPARAAGLTDTLIGAILHDDRASIPHRYSVLLDTMDVVLELKSIPKDVQDEMITLYRVQGLLEVVTLCGFYRMVGEITQAFDVPLPETAVQPFA